MAFIKQTHVAAEDRKNRLVSQVNALRTDRMSFESHWRELSELFRPRRARFTVSDRQRGQKRSEKIIDSTPIFAARTLAAGMMSGVTSPARPWFRLTISNKQIAELHAVRVWLEEVRDRMAAAFIRSNLYNQLPSYYADMGVFGTAAMIVEEDEDTVIRCTHFSIGEYWLASNDKHQVRTFAREFELTVRQVVQKFGIFDGEGRLSDENLSKNVISQWQEGKYDGLVKICHLITENPSPDPDRLEARYKPFLSVYWESEASGAAADREKFLEETGFDEFPVIASRWESAPGDNYGTDCPGMTALSDNKALQFGEKLKAQALEKMVKPPMIAPLSMKMTPASTLPGAITYTDETGDRRFRPAMDTSGFRVDLLGQEQNSVRARLEKAFFVDLFLLISQSDRREITATEIRVRQEEKLLNLGPVLERLNEDALDPLIDRAFNIMLRRGIIPPPPEELEGEPLRVEYVSIMAQAQKAIGRVGVETTTQFIAQLAALDPSALDKWDMDQTIDIYAEMTGVPPSMIVSDEQVQEKRAARAAQQQKEQAALMAAEEAKAVKDLANAPMGGDTALSRIMQGASGITTPGQPAGGMTLRAGTGDIPGY